MYVQVEFLTKTEYLKCLLQAVDAFIVLCAWLDEAHIFSGGIGKVFRLTRVLRPLRLIKKNKSLRALMEVRELYISS